VNVAAAIAKTPVNQDCPADLARFFAPRSVALVGATEGSTRFGGRCLGRMIEFGYGGKIFPISPRHEELRGLRCYPSLTNLPEVPDHVGIVVPADAVLGVLRECAALKVPFATVFTGGFSEAGTDKGREMQAEIVALARETGIRVMGPNCNGLINFRDAFAMSTTATIAGVRRPAGDIAVVSQSGGVGQVNTMWRAQAAGLNVSYEVSCGNSADLDVIDFLNFMVDDELSKVVLMVVEHIPDGARLAEAATRAADREKPIVMLKLGRTEAGGRAAASHTGAMAGSDVVADAALRQLGIIRVTDTSELYEQAMLLRSRRWPRGNRIATTTPSGGNAVLLVDLGSANGLIWPEYQPQTRDRLTAVLPKLGSASNPTDLTNVAVGRADIYTECFEAISADNNIDAIVPIFTMSASGDLQALADAAKATDKPVALLWTGGCTDKPSMTARDIAAAGTPVFTETMSCIRAVAGLITYSSFLRERATRPVPTRPPGLDRAAAADILKIARGTLTERMSRAVFSAYGLPQLRQSFAHNADEAAEIAEQFNTPMVMKIESPDIPHKTDAGGIRLDVVGPAAARVAFDEIVASCTVYRPDAVLNGVVVQEMAPAGLDMIVGLNNDPVFGPVVVVGVGGIHVELMRDIAYRVAPVNMTDARAMLSELKAYPLLEGVRGAKPRDIGALADAIVRLSWLGHDFCNEIAELDINPLRIGEVGEGLWVLDGLIATTLPDTDRGGDQ
jgi:acetate---CoA ligase (ADP-forming)